MNAFWMALTLCFGAEFGDKSQWLILGYATRFSLRQITLGICLGTALVLLMPAILGAWISRWLPAPWVAALSGLCFLVFAFWALRKESDSQTVHRRLPFPILAIAATLFISEFGDKTMLVTATLAASHAWLSVWLGATVGMILADLTAVALGRLLHRSLPERHLRWGAFVLFLAFAVWYFLKAMSGFRPSFS